jgi:hypothetical protein
MLKPETTKLIKSLTRVLRMRDADHHPIPLPLQVATLSPLIIQKMIKAILMNGHEVTGSSLTKNDPPDIDVHVPGLRLKFVDVYARIMESLSHIEYDACRVQSTIEKTNVLYGENIDCRYIVVVTVHQESGVEKEIMIDLTDGEFDPPVYITGTVKAKKMNVKFKEQPSSTNRRLNQKMQEFDFVALSNQANRNTFTTVLVPDYNGTYSITTLEKIMEMQMADRSEVNPQSVLFGYNIIASLGAIRRINDTNNKKKFLGGVDYKKTIKIIISRENLCEPDWCSCNQGDDHIYQHGSTNRTFVTLQCCGTTVCADLLTNNMKATYKAQFCPFSGSEGPHFMQFVHNSLLKPRHKTLMTRLNQHWTSIELEREILVARKYEKVAEDMKEMDRGVNSAPHGDGCSCHWSDEHNSDPVYARRKYNEYNVPPLYDHFDDDPLDDLMPEIVWDDEANDQLSTVTGTGDCFGSPHTNKYKLKDNDVFPILEKAVVMDREQIDASANTVPVTYNRTMTPHCNTPGCKRCSYKMTCFQTWASSLCVTPNVPVYNLAMSLPRHMSLNL